MRTLSSFAVLIFIGVVFAGVILLVRAVVNSYGFRFRWKWWSVVLVLALLVFIGNGLLYGTIDLSKVDRMELETYDHISGGHAELTQAEQWMIAFLYNTSWRGGQITAEPCCDGYRVEIYLNDGGKIGISEGVSSKMIVTMPGMYAKDRFYAACPLLISYIYILTEKYDLPME